ncbi:hypothetical protein, partial [Pseudomonas aeruginosa]|uniref:hypothetical protein n=1 Tax=Pseudomonas aeruginosa TaxID=287 RepID=UPI00195542FD
EQFLAGLLALAGVLGVGEGHLLHRKALRVKSADFAKSGSLFQSFLRQYPSEALRHWRACGELLEVSAAGCPADPGRRRIPPGR